MNITELESYKIYIEARDKFFKRLEELKEVCETKEAIQELTILHESTNKKFEIWNTEAKKEVNYI